MSYRKDHQSLINENNYTQNVGNFVHHEGTDFTTFSSKKIDGLFCMTFFN